MKKLKILKALLLLLTVTITFNSCRRDIDAAPDDQTQEDTTSFQKLMINGNEVLIKQENGKYYISDDEVLSERQLNILKDLARKNMGTVKRSAIISDVVKKWPDGIWYYKIVSSRRTEILQAMSWIAANSSVKFVERTNQTNYVIIYDTNAPTSSSNHIGMESYSKEIYISASHAVGTIAHEILHSLGFFHEQNRPDRDHYINVYLDRIPSNDYITRYQYQINPLATGIGAFDFNSIMMYSSNGIMEKKNGQGWQRQRDSLSLGDIEGLANLYGPPSSICNSGIYTVTSGTSVTLQYATNVANVTSLGNNQYRITRIGNANGIVTLKSLLNGNAYTKDIAVGAVNNSVLSGSTNLFKGNIYTYSITNYNPNNTYQVILNGAGSYKRFLTLKKIDNQMYTIDATNFPDMGLSIPFQLQVRYSSACGVSAYNPTNIYIRPGNGPEW
ncbi:Flavastacin precursor [Sphingobacterium spiritivorum]|uniref:Flavastacin n=1 Tax=Sphingobacterium spiritivorum TaxID=258 RepID=A0A380B9X5_SPHSI|nr:M12 family metallopeptidase [Sphingobacterium spiritivorum]SUI97853.1 Flavastacin precursor [Sphingobacterium spiritivorum]